MLCPKPPAFTVEVELTCGSLGKPFVRVLTLPPCGRSPQLHLVINTTRTKLKTVLVSSLFTCILIVSLPLYSSFNIIPCILLYTPEVMLLLFDLKYVRMRYRLIVCNCDKRQRTEGQAAKSYIAISLKINDNIYSPL